MNRHLLTTIIISNLFFWSCLGFGVYFWLENRDVKVEAEQHYQKMLEANTQCDRDNLVADPSCQQMVRERLALDREVVSSSHYDSLTRLFIAFAIFFPAIAWASYFLTRAIFT
jgi:hypothetical protein